jgi:4,5-dihydroxyphthalate decarboxylase
MGKLQLSAAIGDYDRMRPLVDGLVQIDSVDAQFMLLDPEEIFFRAFRHADFDVCELSLSSYSVKTAAGTSPYIAVPVFPSRAFRHTSVYVRTDRIKSPADLKGRRVGVPEYQLTANIWVRLFLEEDYGIRPSDITWVRGGYEHPGRVEKISLNLPSNVIVENARSDATISDLLASGELDAVIGPRAPSCFDRGIPMSAISLPIRRRPRPNGTGGRASFPLCTRSASAALWSKDIRGCR